MSTCLIDEVLFKMGLLCASVFIWEGAPGAHLNFNILASLGIDTKCFYSSNRDKFFCNKKVNKTVRNFEGNITSSIVTL